MNAIALFTIHTYIYIYAYIMGLIKDQEFD